MHPPSKTMGMVDAERANPNMSRKADGQWVVEFIYSSASPFFFDLDFLPIVPEDSFFWWTTKRV